MSKILGNERSILVWLPPQYQTDSAARYPVLYLHDGQNCFDAATSFAGEWRADETAGELIAAGKIAPIIMVAVANAGSAESMNTRRTRDASQDHGGKGELYAKFLIEELKPFIDSNYRTLSDRAHTAVAGSSLGGLISLYMGYKHGDVFSMCGVISPSLWWDDCSLLKEIQAERAADEAGESLARHRDGGGIERGGCDGRCERERSGGHIGGRGDAARQGFCLPSIPRRRAQ